MQSYLIFLILLLPLSITSQVSAKDEKKDEKPAVGSPNAEPAKTPSAQSEEDEEVDQELENGTIAAEIPPNLQNKGYTLRVEDEEEPIALNGTSVNLETSSWEKDVELVGPDNRILDSDRAYIDRFVISQLKERQWWLGMLLGASETQEGPWKKVFQRGNFHNYSVELAYQPGALGVLTSVSTVARSRSVGKYDIDSTYDSTQAALCLTYALAPFSGIGLPRLHSLIFVGGNYATHKIIIKDEYVSISESANSWGGLGGIDLRLPIINNFWIFGRLSLSYYQIKMPDLDFSASAPYRNYFIGGLYAFSI